MVNIIKDLGVTEIHGRRVSCIMIKCEKCGIEKKVRKIDWLNREYYLCKSCSQIKHGLSNTKGYRTKKQKEMKEKNPERYNEIRRKATKKYREKNKEKISDYHYIKNYGITRKEAIELKEKGCFICGVKEKLVIDHCHDTGKIRGILCDKHNVVLGRLGDTKESILIALEKYKEYFG